MHLRFWKNLSKMGRFPNTKKRHVRKNNEQEGSSEAQNHEVPHRMFSTGQPQDEGGRIIVDQSVSYPSVGKRGGPGLVYTGRSSWEHVYRMLKKNHEVGLLENIG